MRGRGALALLLVLLLLIPHTDTHSNPILLVRTLVWGSKIIRVSLPFSVQRLKNVYQLWKARGRPYFSKLKIPFTTAVAYIGVSWLLNEFERIYQLEQTSSSNVITGIGFNYDTVCFDGTVNFDTWFCPCNAPNGCTASGLIASMVIYANNTASWTTGTDSAPPCGNYANSARGAIRFYYQGSLVLTHYIDINVTDTFAQALLSMPCGSIPTFDLDQELSKLLPNLIDAPIEAYPTADDPAYTDAFEIPPENGDSVSITDTDTGQTTEETASQNDQGQTQTDTQTGQVEFPEDNVYDPTIENIPTKKDIPSLIQTFINGSPLMRWIQGANIQASAGACSVSGSWSPNGQVHSFVLDFCPLQPYLNQIGSFILAFAHLYALYIVFRIK